MKEYKTIFNMTNTYFFFLEDSTNKMYNINNHHHQFSTYCMSGSSARDFILSLTLKIPLLTYFKNVYFKTHKAEENTCWYL